MASGVVVRFDAKRGYGFINPDDGGTDVFVHQNNIVMEGFRYLRVGEKVSYELEVGEKGMKAVTVNLLEERPPQEPRDNYREPRNNDGYDNDGEGEGDGYSNQRREPRRKSNNKGHQNDSGADSQALDSMRRKQERLISLLVEKGVLKPGEIDGIDANADYDDDSYDDEDADYEDEEQEQT